MFAPRKKKFPTVFLLLMLNQFFDAIIPILAVFRRAARAVPGCAGEVGGCKSLPQSSLIVLM